MSVLQLTVIKGSSTEYSV